MLNNIYKIQLLIICTLLIYNISWSTNSKTSKLLFTENKGQWNANVKYKSTLSDGTVFLENDGITYLISEKVGHSNCKHQSVWNEQEHEHTKIIKHHAFNFKWLNKNSLSSISAKNKELAYENYFIGNDKNKWQTNVGNYKTVIYNNLYNNINANIYSTNHSLKVDYIIKKGGNINDIQLLYNGADEIKINKIGQLEIKTSVHNLIEMQPYVYQIINGMHIQIGCKYELKNNILSFKLLEDYNKEYDLIIDPTLIFSTYSGSPVDNWGSSATYDSEGNMFLGGIALAPGYPTTLGAFQTNFGGGFDDPDSTGLLNSDLVITKFNSTGTGRIYSTHLGGSKNELLKSLYCTPNNDLVILSVTGSPDFPTTPTAFDTSFNGGIPNTFYLGFLFDSGVDVAIAKLNSQGSALIGSTYFGGTGNDGLGLGYNYGDRTRGDIAITNNGDIIICSSTSSLNLPNTAGRFQPNFGGSFIDGFVARFNSDLNINKWSSYFGSIGIENTNGLTLDKNENIFICGVTDSPNLPNSSNGLNPTYHGNYDAYITKINSDATQVLVTTYLGTNNYDQAFLLDTDNDGNIIVLGQTIGNYLVTPGTFSNPYAPQFIHKLNNNLNTTIFSTVFGHTTDTSQRTINISPTALLVDICGSIYVVGWGGAVNNQGSTDSMYTTNDAFQKTTDGSDFYFINFNRDATQVIYATYFGENGGVGDHVDGGTSRFDKNGVVYQAVCASCGGTDSFPTTVGAYSNTNNNDENCNMAGFKFRFDLLAMQIIDINPKLSCSSDSVSFTYTSTQPATSFLWNFGDGSTSTLEFPKHKYNSPGSYTVKLVLRNPNNCNVIDSASIVINIQDNVFTTKDTTICNGSSILFNNQIITQEGTYKDTLKTALGCDSIITLRLSVLPTPTPTTNKDTTLCIGSSIVFNNQVITQSGTYKDTLKTILGCDSIIVLNINFNSILTENENVTICEGNSIVFNNITITESGIYKDTSKSVFGCDSIITLNVRVIENQFSTIDTSICEGESIQIEQNIFNTQGVFTIKIKSSDNCDSTITLNLNIKQKRYNNIDSTICDGDFVQVGNNKYSVTGIYKDTLVAINKCDSIVTLDLKVLNNPTTYIYPEICEGDNFIIDDSIFNKTGLYQLIYEAKNKCDSILNINLTVHQNKTKQLFREICEGDSIIIENMVYKNSGNYTQVFRTSKGCDSTINLELIVYNHKNTNIDTSICFGDSILVGNHFYKENGQFIENLQTSKNCDSIVTLNLEVYLEININAIANKNSIEYGESVQLDVETNQDLGYIWSPENIVDNSQIKNPNATPTEPTWFVVEATNTTTNCKVVDSVFVNVLVLPCNKDYVYIPNAFTPNGDNVNDVFRVRSKNLTSGTLMVFDRWGNKVFESDDINIGWDGTYKGKQQQQEAYGFYFVGTCNGGDSIVIKGNVTLLK